MRRRTLGLAWLVAPPANPAISRRPGSPVISVGSIIAGVNKMGRKVRATKPDLRTRLDEQFPVTTSQIGENRETYQAALELARGDHRRLIEDDDGHIIVSNQPARRSDG